MLRLTLIVIIFLSAICFYISHFLCEMNYCLSYFLKSIVIRMNVCTFKIHLKIEITLLSIDKSVIMIYMDI